jgi:hypothetical protein
MNKNRREVVSQTVATHRLNLRKNLERRLEAAKARGDENLVRLLEAEASYLQ